MHIDLFELLVTFDEGATLSLDQLRGIVAILEEEELDQTLADVAEYVSDVPLTGMPEHVFEVQSSNKRYLYAAVRLVDGTWACSCPDWIFRHSESGDHCKHISRLIWLY